MLDEWMALAGEFNFHLSSAFIRLLHENMFPPDLNWRILDPREALTLQAELYGRYPLPDRSWEGIPFAVSTVGEDVACFDLTGPPDREALVLPIRDWNGPRWEYMGDRKSFEHWFKADRGGRLI